MTVRILLVDDHPVVRSGLRRDLERQPGWTVVGEASGADAALECVRRLTPDLVIMDVHLGERNGLEVSQQILEEFPFLKLLIFSADASLPLVDRALQIGIMGYILKINDPEEIIRAVQMALEGRLYLCPDVASVVFDGYRKMLMAKGSGKPQLTERERMVLRLIAEGCASKNIADQLKVSIKAVEKTRARIMIKLGYHSVAELARYAVREGLVSR
jgi:DNA-binding NarL/FixJ family response regulator